MCIRDRSIRPWCCSTPQSQCHPSCQIEIVGRRASPHGECRQAAGVDVEQRLPLVDIPVGLHPRHLPLGAADPNGDRHLPGDAGELEILGADVHLHVAEAVDPPGLADDLRPFHVGKRDEEWRHRFGLDDGPEVVEPESVTPLLIPLPDVEGSKVVGEAWWVDRFGNVQVNIGPEDLELAGITREVTVTVRIGSTEREVPWVETYGDVDEGEPLLHIDSSGLAALAVRGGSATDYFNLAAGMALTLGG